MNPNHHCLSLCSLILALISSAFAAQTTDSHPTDPGKIVQDDLGIKLDDYLSRMEAFGFHGAMLIEVDGEVVLAKGYGIADRRLNTPITTQTVFDIGSLSKQFLATAALLLESQGRLSVSDAIEVHLENVPDDKRGITIHQLLTHTAGLPYLPRTDNPLAEQLTSAPGERYAYSNVGYTLLGRVLDAAADEPFEDFISREIFRKVGMNQTWFRKDLPSTQPHMARAYTDDTDHGTPAEMRLPASLRGAGDIISTLGDLLLWEHALQNRIILDDSSTERFFTEHARNDADTMGYTYGWMVFRTARDTRILAHAGNYGGFNCDYRRYVDEGMTIVCLSNQFINGRSMRDAVMNNVSLIAIGGDAKWPPKPSTTSGRTNELEPGGRFRIDADAAIVVEMIGDRLHLQADSQAAMTAVFLPDANEAEREFAAFASRESERVLSGLMAGDTEPFTEHVSPSLQHSAGRSIAERCAAMIESHGPFTGAHALGTTPVSDANGRAFLRATFERGERLIQITWSGRRIVHFAEADRLPTREFLPIENGAFAAYDIFTNRSAILHFETPDNDESTLRITAGKSEHLARALHQQPD
ncbi:MAG: beta-lactamase family protein [Phycisphaerales bacterium]|nr:beta-lactamase family protein [Phycisphaerales bacterium]